MKGNEAISYKRSFLIGMFLGDAYVRRVAKHKLTAEWTISHSTKSADLVEWKRDKLVKVFGISEPKIHTRPNAMGKERCIFSFTRDGLLRIVGKWFKQNGVKTITPKIRFLSHPIGLAMLLCDDGSVRRRKKVHKDGSVYYLKPSLTIATHNFSLEEVKRLLGHISATFGIDGSINPERRMRNGRPREYHRSHFNVENSRKLWKLVAPHIPRVPSMNAKFAYAYNCFGH